MRLTVICALVAGCGGNGTGTVVYSEAGTGHIMTVDVATGAAAPLDLGFFGDVSIAADRQHVAYVGEDNIPKVSDLAGQVAELPETHGCNSPLAWGPGSSLSYCIGDPVTGFAQIGFLPHPGAVARTLTTGSVAISSDGARIAYLSLPNPSQTALGDLVVEDADGANRQVLMSQVEVNQIAFAPDDGSLVITDVLQANNFAEHVARVTLSGAVTDLGAAAMVMPLPGGARFSPDGHEVLVATGSQLVGLDLATGATHPFAMGGNGIQIIGAAFLAPDRIVYARQDSSFEGDVGSTTNSVRFADGTDRVTLVSSDGSSNCMVADVAASAGQIALVCAVPAIVDLNGELITSRNATFALGISGDHQGMVTVDNLGAIEFVADDGGVRPLATAMTANQEPLIGPFAAYAP